MHRIQNGTCASEARDGCTWGTEPMARVEVRQAGIRLHCYLPKEGANLFVFSFFLTLHAYH